jgi:GT2 family glycosyltransferase
VNTHDGGEASPCGAGSSDPAKPDLSGIAVHWYNEDDAEFLASSWPDDPRFELLIVDNGSERGLRLDGTLVLDPGANLGFAGAVNHGLRSAHGDIVLILNTDITVEPGALESLLEGFRQHPEAAALAPRLVGPEGEPQYRWQLRPLPSVWTLMLQSLLIPIGDGPGREPDSGSAVEQPAAAALAIRRQTLAEMGGLDETFYPAWFEDVDLAARLHDAGHVILYWAASAFRHRLGSTIPGLGFRQFLWTYYANLGRYLRKHHGPVWAAMARWLLAPACLLRILVLPVRKPRRAADRRSAASGLTDVMIGALTNWRLPRESLAATCPPNRSGSSK